MTIHVAVQGYNASAFAEPQIHAFKRAVRKFGGSEVLEVNVTEVREEFANTEQCPTVALTAEGPVVACNTTVKVYQHGAFDGREGEFPRG